MHMLVVIVVFVSAFVVVALLLMAIGMGARQESKQTLERLDTLMKPGSDGNPDEILNLRREEVLSKIPWLNRLLLRFQIAPALRLLIYQAGLTWTVGGVLTSCVAAGGLTGWLVYARTGAGLLTLLLAGAAGFAPILYIFRKRQGRYDTFEERLPEALDMMVGAMRAGHSLTACFTMVARETTDPISREFRQCVEEQNFGLELRTALVNMATRMPIADVRTLVTAILIQKETGGNLAEILEKVAYVIRERFRLKRQVSVHTAQGRMTGWVLGALPLVLGVLLYLINPTHMSILWKRPVGIKMMWAAAIMTTIGGLIIRKIVRVRI